MSSRPVTSDAAAAVAIPDHTLLRIIGRGSYGEVWLARNVMGTLRAVKIVRRAAFDSDRPYLREFEGIRRCEPVSRAHDGLIDILHMGRHDAEGWFYYVMELADASEGAPEVENYRPATLAERLNRGPRMEAGECLRIAESLAGALAFLHEQGLIHRDVKPSNIMFVGGVPKLGDIGLVAEAGSSRSFVGTEGFVPQEGPGTERADVFALGKVLYEALTGMDRSKFPLLPQDWRNAYDFEQRVELNEIVLRACEGDTVRRYHSARELLADVALIASGRSVRKMRGMERRVRVLKWIAGSVAVIALAALGGSALWRAQASREQMLRLRAKQAELAALLSQVHAARTDSSPGAVTRALTTAAKAAAAGATPELRDDVIFLLSRPDFVPREDLKIPWTAGVGMIALDADSGLAAEAPAGELTDKPGPLTITLHTAGAPEKRRAFTIEKPPPWLQGLEFSRGGARLLLAGWYGGAVVMDTASGSIQTSIAPSSLAAPALRFCGDKGDTLIRRASEGGLAVFQLPGGERTTTPPLAGWPVQDQRRQFQKSWPSPDGRLVLLIDNELELRSLPGILASLLKPAAAATRGAACLAEVATGRILWKVSGPDEQVAAWSHDGTRIAVRQGDAIVTLDAATGAIAGRVPQRIRNNGTQIAFLASCDLIVFSTWSMQGMCDLQREEIMGRPPVLERWSYSQAHGLLLAGTGAADWRPSPVLRVFHPPPGTKHDIYFAFAPGERWLVIGQDAGFIWWNPSTQSSVPAATTPAHYAADVTFSADGRRAEYLTIAGRHEIPWTGEPLAELPDPLPYGPGVGGRCAYVSASADGSVKAYGGHHFIAVHRAGAEPRVIPTGDSTSPVALSPDGRWLAIGAHHERDVRILDLNSGSDAPVHTEPLGQGCSTAFSPDGKWLACAGASETRILESGTWGTIHKRPMQSGSMGYASFSRDGRLLSAKETWSRCAIIEPGTWRTLFHFDSPLGEIFGRCALSASGRYFAAAGTRQEVYVWDLKTLAMELQKLGLAGDLPAFAE